MLDFYGKNGFPEAIICSNDYRASQIVDVARELGVKVPDQLKLIGAHNTPWAEAYQLTSFDSNVARIARECRKILDDDLTSDGEKTTRKRIMVKTKLIFRKSFE